MNARWSGYAIAVAIVILTGVFGALYLLKAPPFSKGVGDIEASAVCDSLGSGDQAADALKTVLPQKSSYAFDDKVDLRVDEQDSSYRSDCFVSGNGDQLLQARTQMFRNEPFQSWVDSEVAQYAGGHGSPIPFTGNLKGTATPSVAAVFVPCASAGKIPGGQYNLSVVVHLERAGEVSKSDARAGLIELAKTSAEYAHARANCDIDLP